MKTRDSIRYAIDALEERVTYLMIEIADTTNGETRVIEKRKLAHLQEVIKTLRSVEEACLTKLMWDEKQIPKGCTCSHVANLSGYVLVIADDCPVHNEYMKTWKEGMCTIINRSTTEIML